MARKPQPADRRVCAASASPPGQSGLTLVACGALARELLVITSQFPDDVLDITCLPASWHNHPERIVPGLRRKVSALRRKGRDVAVVYGDCGTGGEIDAFLTEQQVDRIPGPHCYEVFLGPAEFADEMERELGTFFLTDYMVRHFERIVMQGMGLRKHPQLRDMYFGNYRRVLYIAQTEDMALQDKARAAAAELDLEYDYRFTGFGDLASWVETRLQTAALPATGE